MFIGDGHCDTEVVEVANVLRKEDDVIWAQWKLNKDKRKKHHLSYFQDMNVFERTVFPPWHAQLYSTEVNAKWLPTMTTFFFFNFKTNLWVMSQWSNVAMSKKAKVLTYVFLEAVIPWSVLK